MTTKYVNTYLVSQAYGGPEEGGWWYTKGVPVESVRTENHAANLQDGDYEAEDVLDFRRKWCEKENAERLPIHSVNSRGVYQVRVEKCFAQPYPAERPHYE